MNDINIKEKLRKDIGEKRYEHSLRVANTVICLAKRYGVDDKKAYVAGLLHDCGKYREKEFLEGRFPYTVDFTEDDLEIPDILHAELGAVLAREEYGIKDPEILSAIASHCIGKEKMTDLEMLVYLADAIEPSRDFSGIERIRALSTESLMAATLLAMDFGLQYLIERDELIHPVTIRARNQLLKNMR